jgi:hypothetical protein
MDLPCTLRVWMPDGDQPAALSPELDWRALFDVVKELNAHAGRLATLIGLLLAASTFSLTNGLIHDAIASVNVERYSLLYGCLAALGLNLFGSLTSVLRALDPVVPTRLSDPNAWAALGSALSASSAPRQKLMLVYALNDFAEQTGPLTSRCCQVTLTIDTERHGLRARANKVSLRQSGARQ